MNPAQRRRKVLSCQCESCQRGLGTAFCSGAESTGLVGGPHLDTRRWAIRPRGPSRQASLGAAENAEAGSTRHQHSISRVSCTARAPTSSMPWHWIPAAAAGPACKALGIPLIDGGSIRMGPVPRRLGRPRRSIMHWADLVVANPWSRRLECVARGAREGGGSSTTPSTMPGFTARRFWRLREHRGALHRGHGRPHGAAKGLPEYPGGSTYSGAGYARSVELPLVGNGPDRARLMESARDLDGRRHSDLPEDSGLEAVGEMPRQRTSGLLMTDPALLAEGCSNSILEYMACGLPVVCSDSGDAGGVGCETGGGLSGRCPVSPGACEEAG